MENYENHLEDMIKGFQILRYPLLNDTPITNKIPENSVDIAAKYLKILKDSFRVFIYYSFVPKK